MKKHRNKIVMGADTYKMAGNGSPESTASAEGSNKLGLLKERNARLAEAWGRGREW